MLGEVTGCKSPVREGIRDTGGVTGCLDATGDVTGWLNVTGDVTGWLEVTGDVTGFLEVTGDVTGWLDPVAGALVFTSTRWGRGVCDADRWPVCVSSTTKGRGVADRGSVCAWDKCWALSPGCCPDERRLIRVCSFDQDRQSLS
jgi:hypothetical protein